MPTNNPLRLGKTITWQAPTELIAQNLEAVLQSWPVPDAVPDIQLGDLTAYNAGRQLLITQRDALAEERSLIEEEMKSTGSTAKQKGQVAKLKSDIRRIEELLRATEIDTNPGGGS